MLGVWEAGRLVQVSSILTNAAREGARTAAGGRVNGTDVTVTIVQQTVRDYLRAAGLPTAAVNGAQIQLVNTSGNNWIDPVDAQPGDTFRVTATIPAGAPFDSLKFVLANSLTNVTQLSVTVNWASNNDELLSVDTQLPY
jgi:Flp pilus assembly protein TadG